MPIRNKLILLFVLFVTLPLFFTAFLSYQWMARETRNQKIISLKSISKLKINIIEQTLVDTKRELKKAGADWNIKQDFPILLANRRDPAGAAFRGAEKALDEKLQLLQESEGWQSFLLLDPEGRMVYATNRAYYTKVGLGKLFPFPDVIEQGKRGEFLSDIVSSPLKEGDFSIMGAVPARNEAGKIIGIIVFDYDMAPIYRLILDPLGLGKTGETIIVKRTGDKLIYLNPLRFDAQAALRRTVAMGTGTGVAAQRAVGGKGGSGTTIDYRGKRVLAVWDRIPSLDWGIVVKIDEQEAMLPVYQFQWLLLLLMAVSIGTTVVLSWPIARSVSEPILKLKRAAAQVSAGDLSIEIKAESRDEIGELAEAFTKMIDALRAAQEIQARWQESLKAKVEEATFALSNKIKELEDTQHAVLNVADDLNAEKNHLLESEARFREIFDTSAIGMAEVALDGKFIMVNKMLCDITGYSEAELLAKSFQDMTLPDDPAADAEAIRRLVDGEVPHYHVEKRCIRKDRQVVWVMVSRALVHDADGQPLYFVAQIGDITRRKEIDRLKDEFVATVSHELRTPLTIIREGVDMVFDGLYGKINEEQKKLLLMAEKNIDRLARLINDLLNISRIEARRMILNLQVVDICAEVVRAITPLERDARNKGLYLKMEYPKQPLYITADSDKLDQIFVNLITNSIKFTDKGGITVNIGQDGENVKAEISDTGRGIAAHDLPRIFSKFTQFGRAEGSGARGTGLGLAITKGLVELHGGKIWAKSEPGKGTTLTFTIPLAKEVIKRG